jgi:SPP1 family predicted phage head-tail adaptor
MPRPHIAAGELRHVIAIMQPTLAQDANGNISPSAQALVANARAKVEALTGRELYQAQQRVSEVTHRITIRWQAGIKAKQNVWFDSRQFQIEAVENPDEVHHLLSLLCIERDDSAREFPGGSVGNATIPVTQPVIFTGDGHTNTFTLPYSPARGIMLFWNGELQREGGFYTLSGMVVSVNPTPVGGATPDQIDIFYL